MDRLLLEAARKIETADDVDRIWAIIGDALAAYDLPHIIYVTCSDHPPLEWHIRSTLPDNWPEPATLAPSFREPFCAHCCATFEISKMGIEFIDDHSAYIDDATKSYIRKISAFGWISALGIPCALIGNGRHGGFIIGNSMNRQDFERGILPKADMLQTFCLIAHKKLEAIHFKREADETKKPLSPREFQALTLLTKGLRPKQIALELSVSEASIRLYIKNARAKLNAKTKEEGIVLFLKQQMEIKG